MPKVKMIFDTSNPEETMDFMCAIKGKDMACALFEMMHNTKKSHMWNIDAMEKADKDDMYDMLEAIYQKFWEILNDNDINIDKLIE